MFFATVKYKKRTLSIITLILIFVAISIGSACRPDPVLPEYEVKKSNVVAEDIDLHTLRMYLSPDGKHLSFIQIEYTDVQYWTMVNLENGNKIELELNLEGPGRATWAPDSTKVVYSTSISLFSDELYHFYVYDLEAATGEYYSVPVGDSDWLRVMDWYNDHVLLLVERNSRFIVKKYDLSIEELTVFSREFTRTPEQISPGQFAAASVEQEPFNRYLRIETGPVGTSVNDPAHNREFDFEDIEFVQWYEETVLIRTEQGYIIFDSDTEEITETDIAVRVSRQALNTFIAYDAMGRIMFVDFGAGTVTNTEITVSRDGIVRAAENVVVVADDGVITVYFLDK